MDEVLKKFLKEDDYIDFGDIMVVREAQQATLKCRTDEEKAKALFEFVRDEVENAYNIDSIALPYRASTTVKARVGTDDAKAVLLAALLRYCGIPAGFCYQYLCKVDDDSLGHYMHCYNALYLDGRWIKVDACGRKNGNETRFYKVEPSLAFNPRDVYGEYNVKGIYSEPNYVSLKVIAESDSVLDVMKNLPDYIDGEPDIKE